MRTLMASVRDYSQCSCDARQVAARLEASGSPLSLKLAHGRPADAVRHAERRAGLAS
jgi:hypothetical protein